MPLPKFKQGDLVNLKDPQKLPDGTAKYHPFLIVSSNRYISHQLYYTGVMMTSTKTINKFCFPCEGNMFEAKLKDFSHVNMYIIAGFNEESIKDLRNRMIPIHFKGFMSQLKEFIFCVD